MQNENIYKFLIQIPLILACIFYSFAIKADPLIDKLERIQNAYPAWIKSFSSKKIIWRDDDVMQIEDDNPYKTQEEKLVSPSLTDQIMQAKYPKELNIDEPPA